MTLHRLLAGSAVAALLAACTPSSAPPAETPDAPTATAPAPAPSADAGADAAGDGVEFPSLRIATLDGGTFDLAERRGQWVVVNFWATWCAPCLKEMPELSALDAMRDHIDVVGLAYEEIEPADMQAFLEKRPVVYPIAILDTYDPPADFDTPKGLPMTYLIAPDGRVARKFLGPVTAEGIEAMIAEAGGPAPAASPAGA
ncbi:MULTISPECIES: TlpA family protein disulfide reductase [Luteimonas]|uniref:TlpA family protein disulfide reductase n=1 Tax=Luteimonas TaxID=83614 RepID=UPI000C7C0DCF|nr:MULTISPECIES: TlpA disulfide reductase family protein [Luteimonas]